MDSIYLEKIYHDYELVGIGMICRTKEQAVEYMRDTKKQLEEEGASEIIHYCEHELPALIFKDKVRRTAYFFEQRDVK